MFYSPVYLKRSGRFGLIWLAATQTKVLSKRELATINVSTICSDIYTHIPGLKERGSRASRFSLYLCCQLMYGSVRVLQKQWDILLVDAQMLCKRCTDTPSNTKGIDMATTRQEMCIESKVPRNEKEANTDPYFGAHKEATVDVESMLTYLESLSEDRVLRLEPMPMPVQPEIGSPHSVSDPKEIQIRDFQMPLMSIQVHEEQDLPKMDIESFMAIDQNESLLEIQEGLKDITEQERSERQSSLDEQMMGQVSIGDGQTADFEGVIGTEDRNTSMMREILMEALPQTEVSMGPRGPLSPLEETPMAKPTSGMPGPPHKPKLDRPKRQRDPNKKGSRFQDICNENLQNDQDQVMAPVAELTSSDDSFQLRQQQKEREKENEANKRGHGHDWAQKNSPKVALPPIAARDSPLRKRRPHKLVIDQCLMISRLELRQHIEATSDTVMPMELPNTSKIRNIYQEPGLDYLRQKVFAKLFTKNCKFGLRTDDTGSEPDSQPSPRLIDVLPRKRAHGAEDVTETPANKIARTSSEVASVEKARDRTGSLSDSVDRNRSHSLILDESNRKNSGASMGDNLSLPLDNDTSKEGSILERDITVNHGGALSTWPEEQELVISPVRRVSEAPAKNAENIQTVVGEVAVLAAEKSPQEAAPTNITADITTDSVWTEFSDTPRTTVYKLVENNLRSRNDWTTFQDICPTSKYSRKVAASMFNALLSQISRGKLCARQDEPFSYIFIWVMEFSCRASSSSES